MDEDLLLGMLLKFWLDRRRERIAAIAGHFSAVEKLLRSRRLRRELMGVWAIMEMNAAIRNLPHQRSRSHGPLKTPEDFTAAQFLEQFRFRQAHFYRILACLKDEHGRAMMSGGE
eukprot:3931626-Rhodomonas_salina.1